SEDIRRIGELGNASARFAADLLTFYGRAYRRLYNGNDEGPVHDPCAVLAVTHPELFELQERHVRVECAGHRTRGMTVVDERSLPEGEPANTEVAYRIDAARARELLLDAIQQLP
ncbi:MAG TPA: nucleoside hydrolase, partial [Trueperaceae bacterium]